ncbi:MAG: Hsp33 family molecular chaperone HslO [Fibrobacterota bacterium]
MEDKIYRGITRQGHFRAAVAVSTGAVRKITGLHGTPSMYRRDFGRVINTALLLATNLKGRGSLSFSLKSDGLLSSCQADAGPTGYVRGYIPETLQGFNGGNVENKPMLGSGVITVTRMVEGWKKPAVSSVDLIPGKFADSVARYLNISEQRESAFGCETVMSEDGSIAFAGGFYIEKLPEAAEGETMVMEEIIKALPPLKDIFRPGAGIDQISDAIFGRFGFNVLKDFDINPYCPCSKDRVLSALRLSGRDEIQAMIRENKPAEAVCRFCREKYSVNQEELEAMLK